MSCHLGTNPYEAKRTVTKAEYVLCQVIYMLYEAKGSLTKLKLKLYRDVIMDKPETKAKVKTKAVS